MWLTCCNYVVEMSFLHCLFLFIHTIQLNELFRNWKSFTRNRSAMLPTTNHILETYGRRLRRLIKTFYLTDLFLTTIKLERSLKVHLFEESSFLKVIGQLPARNWKTFFSKSKARLPKVYQDCEISSVWAKKKNNSQP